VERARTMMREEVQLGRAEPVHPAGP
jgi:hypothetical protein